jgi:hypothetical protein
MCADGQTLAAIRRRADHLVDQARPLSTNKAVLLVSLCARYPVSNDDTADRRCVS